MHLQTSAGWVFACRTKNAADFHVRSCKKNEYAKQGRCVTRFKAVELMSRDVDVDFVPD